MLDIFLKPKSQGPMVGWLWIGSFGPDLFKEGRKFAKRNRMRGRVRCRMRKKQAH